MTEYNKAIVGAVAGAANSPVAIATNDFIREWMAVLDFPDAFAASAGVLGAALVNFLIAGVAVYAVPDSRLTDAHRALGKRRLAGEKDGTEA